MTASLRSRALDYDTSATVNGALYRALRDPSRRVGAVLEASGIHPGGAWADAVLGRVDLVGSAAAV